MSFARPFITLLAAALLIGCGALPTISGNTNSGADTQAASTATESSDSGYADEYLIGVGDSLAINVWRNKDLSVTVPVRPDGKISVPLAGDVAVGDRTPEEVSASITQKLSKYIRDPFVTVIVTDMGSDQYRSRVRVTGAVRKPVSLPFRQGMTVLDVVLEAGGATEFANLSSATLYRSDGTRLAVRLDRILKRGEMATNYKLRRGDVVTVPQSAF
jgi:polysaccharide export outer membrane protein